MNCSSFQVFGIIMIERPIFVEVVEGNDSMKNPIIKVVIFKGVSLECLKNEIRNRFDLSCDTC